MMHRASAAWMPEWPVMESGDDFRRFNRLLASCIGYERSEKCTIDLTGTGL